MRGRYTHHILSCACNVNQSHNRKYEMAQSSLSSWRYVFISQKAYQESETRPESSVYTLMKGIAVHGDEILDTVEYARPSEVAPDQNDSLWWSSSTLCASLHGINPADNNWRPFSSQGGDVISTILRREFTHDQTQGACAEVRGHQTL